MQNILKQTPLFQGIDEDHLSALIQCLNATEKNYKKGDVILPEGKPTDYICVVLSGMALITCGDVWGNNNILGNAGPGDAFAEAYACIPNEPLMISVCAAEDTAVLFLNAGKVLTTCTNACTFHSQLVQNLLTLCAKKSLQLSRRMIHTSPKTIRGRLLSYFSECAKLTGSLTFDIPYSRQQLADYLSVERSALSKELSKMQQEDLIRYKKNHFTLLIPCA